MASDLPKLVFSWIGDADLNAWAAAEGGTIAEQVRALNRGAARKIEGLGPVRTLVDQVPFDEVHLLGDLPAAIANKFAEWVGPHAHAHKVTLKSPVDYSDIFEAADGVLGTVTAKAGPAALSIHLSPGTPAMTAVWVLLGKSRYPATFYQTHQGKVIETTIPFDLMIDYLPGVLHAADRVLGGDIGADLGNEGFGAVIGKSPQIRAVIARAKRIALRDVGVLLLGESGVGKDVFARALCATSCRPNKPFIAINCAAVPKDLLESELFGHKKGSFSGAIADRAGAFEQADGGTLFLDEVGECDLLMQAKLLRVLQPGNDDPPALRRFNRVGDTKEITADVRIIAATNRDLQAEVAAGRFREDLYYRLATFILKIPPLRERATDIPAIADHLFGRINKDFARTEPGYKHKHLSVSTKKFLSQQLWPGNVRQLYNVLLQAAIMVDGETIHPANIEAGLSDGPSPRNQSILNVPLGNGFSLTEHLDSLQKQFLARAMQEANGKKTAAAKLLGYDNYQTLSAQLDRLGVKWKGE